MAESDVVILRDLALGAALLALGLVAAPLPARAQEAKAAAAPLFLDLLSQPVETHESAIKQSLREAGPPPRRPPTEGRVLPDGSVEYGEGRTRVIVSVGEAGSGAGSGIGGSGFGSGRFGLPPFRDIRPR